MDVDKKADIDSNEKLVDICDYSSQKILFDKAYFKQNIKGSIDRAFVRETVAEKLICAAALLPEGYTFKIFDAWRPFEVQEALYSEYFYKLSLLTENQFLTVSQLHNKAKEFVSFPDKSKSVSYAHSSGGAVDLTIVDALGNELNMGTGFDDFSEKSYTAYYHGDSEIGKNRKMLVDIMSTQGFTNLDSEWWHFDFGDIFWSKNTGNDVIYKSIYELFKNVK